MTDTAADHATGSCNSPALQFGHDLAREPAQRPEIVRQQHQDVFEPHLAKLAEPPQDGIRIADQRIGGLAVGIGFGPVPVEPGQGPVRPDHLRDAVLARPHGGFVFAPVLGEDDGAGEGHLHGIEHPARPGAGRAPYAEPFPGAAERGELVEQDVEPGFGDPGDGFVGAGAGPQRRVGLLHHRRFDHDIAVLPVLAVVAEALLRGPGFEDQPERFLVPLQRFFLRDAEALELDVAVALADAEIEPAARQQVEGRGLLGEQHRIVPRQHRDRRSQPDPLGPGRQIGQQVEGRRDLARAGEVMLDQEDAVIAETLGLLDEVDQLAVALAVRGFVAAPGDGAAEETEFHAGEPPNGLFRLAVARSLGEAPN